MATKKKKLSRDDRQEALVERLVIAQEKQAAFYEKYDAMLAPLMKIAEQQLVALGLMKKTK